MLYNPPKDVINITGNAATATLATLATLATDANELSTATGLAPSYSARAWVSFNGQGAIAIRASGNVSSITDVGVGCYRINFIAAMPDINYAFAGNGQGASAGSLGCNTIPFTSVIPASLVDPTTTSVNFTTWVFNYSGTFDPAFVTAAIFR